MIALRRFMPLLLALTLAACGGSGKSSNDPIEIASDPSALTNDNRPVHNVYFDAEGFAPFVMSDADNRPSGFGIETGTSHRRQTRLPPQLYPARFHRNAGRLGQRSGYGGIGDFYYG